MSRFDERLNGLRWRLRGTRRLWRAGASPQEPFLEPVPQPDGRIDTPRPDDALERGALTVKGWAHFPRNPTARAEVRLGGEQLGFARLGLSRAELRNQTGNALAGVSGFELTADLAGWSGADGATELEVEATSTAGERLLLGPLPVTVGPAAAPGPEAPPDPALPAPEPGRDGRRRVLVFTHQLNLGGAQLYLLDLLRALIEREAIDAVVVSAMDGPVRAQLEELGVGVHISSMVPYDDDASHIGRVEELAVWAANGGFEVALINTATTLALPGAEVAARLGIPAIWAIHESFPPNVLWGDLSPEVRRRADAALFDAAALVFEASSTQRLYEPLARPGHCLTVPYGLDFEPVESAREGFDRAAMREAAGIAADAEVVLCVGTVEPRKAQVALAQAFDLIAARHPKARLALVGGRDDEESLLLSAYIESSANAGRIDLIPVTPDVQSWYGRSDILVCASDVESLPRTVVEAMAWELPVLATDVYGLPDLISEGETGWLCPPRDVDALAAALDRALSSTPAQRRAMGEAGRALVTERHALQPYALEFESLFDRAVSGEPSKQETR